MFEKGKYVNVPVDEIRADLEGQGYEPASFTESPNDYLAPHSHKENHILVVTAGEMKLKLKESEVTITPGDKITLPSGVEHEVWFGPEGCTYFWIKY